MAINIPTISEKFLDNNGQVNSTWYNYLRTGGASNIGDVLPNFFIVSGAYIQESNYWLNLSIDNGWLSGDTYQGAYADLLKLSDASSVNIRFITSDARATEIATYGESGAFVLDTNNKRFKIPMVTKSIGNLSTLSDIGTVFGNSAASGTATYAGVKFPFFMKVGNKTLEASTVDLKKEAADQKAAISSLGQAQLIAISEAGTTQLTTINSAGETQVTAINAAGTIQIDGVNLAGTTQKSEINTAGATQVSLVENAGTTQLGLVNSAGSTQVGLVNSAGVTQVSLVEDEGDTQVARVISEGTSYVTAAQNWAIKNDGPVSGSDYSSKYNANLAYTYAQSVNPDNIVHISGTETITGTKTFTSSPILPTPTTDMQAATKKYIDDITINILNYGGDNTGNNDNSIALINAVASLPSTGGKIIFPAKANGSTYKFSSTVNITKSVILDFNGSTINVANATDNIFIISTTNANNSIIRNFKIISSVAKTAGYYFKFNNVVNGLIENFISKNHFRFVDIDNSQSCRINNGYSDTPSTTSGSGFATIGINNQSGGIDISNIYITVDASITYQTSFGILIAACDTVHLHNVFLIGQGNCLQLQPNSGQHSNLVYCNHCTFDTATNGIAVTPLGTGQVNDLYIDNTWLSVQSSHGLYIENSTGTIQNIHLSGSNTITNAATGIVTVGAVLNLLIHDSWITNNTTGILIGSSTTGEINDEVYFSGNITNITNNAGVNFTGYWNSFSSVISSDSGTFTTVSSSTVYKLIGDICYYKSQVTITNKGTAAGALIISMPFIANDTYHGNGREIAVTGKMLQTYNASNTIHVLDYAGASVITNGYIINVSGFYRV